MESFKLRSEPKQIYLVDITKNFITSTKYFLKLTKLYRLFCYQIMTFDQFENESQNG